MLSAFPMIDGIDRRCRVLHRLMTRRARLCAEMLSIGAILDGDGARLPAWTPAGIRWRHTSGSFEPRDLAGEGNWTLAATRVRGHRQDLQGTPDSLGAFIGSTAARVDSAMLN
jgi:hypothetical protein